MSTVADLLAEGSLGLVPVHVPHASREVRWVATSELVDPTPFLEGGEVLLTTGLETVGWRREWADYVSRLRAVGVVALGLGTGLTHRRVPAGLVRACESEEMNLFEVPRGTTFVAISHAAARMIDTGAEAAARRSLEIQRQLTRAAVRADSRRLLVRRLGEVLDGAAALLGRDGEVLVEPTGALADTFDLTSAVAEVARIAPQGLRAASSVQTSTATSIVQPVGLTGQPSGYLAVQIRGRAGDVQQVAVGTTVSLLGLAAESERMRRQASRQLRARAIELLVQSDARTAGILLAASDDGRSVLPDRLVIARASGGDGLLDEAVAALEEVVPLVGRVRDELWLVAPPSDIAQHAATLADLGLLVGVGDATPAERAAVSHANAGRALATATAAAPVAWWRRLVTEGALGSLDRDLAMAFAESFLAGVPGDDRDLLRSFLRHHGSRLKVAEELGLHRNTVRNRLSQIERTIGRSFDDPQVRVDAWIALQLTG